MPTILTLRVLRSFRSTKKNRRVIFSSFLPVSALLFSVSNGCLISKYTLNIGQEDIESLERLVREHASRLPEDTMRLLVCPIYAALPAAQQALVFEPAPPNTRKVVLATNIAETSITISGIRYVIDSGLAKVRAYDARIGMETLLVQPISKSSARQRTGRAGREAPGACYRLFTGDTYEDLTEDTEPEIRRCNLASVVLNIKASGCEDVLNFDFIDRPTRDSCE